MARLIQASIGFATEGERQAAETLKKLPDGWSIIANKILPASNGRSFEIDFIVVGDRNVFAIDAKSRRGRIHGSDTLWVYDDGSSERSPLNKADYVAKVLAGHLRAQVPRYSAVNTHTVAGCVLLAGTTARPNLQDVRAAAGVLMLADAVETLRHRDAREGDPLVGQLRPQIEQRLVNLSHRPKVPAAINDYVVVDATHRQDGSYVFRVEHAHAGPRLLTMYDVASADASQRDFYLHEFRVLAELRDTGVVPECLDPFTWSEDFLIVPSHLPSGVSLSALPPPDSEAAALQELTRAATAFESLARVHAAGAVHRALGPEAVYVEERDGQPKLMLTGFFAAKRGEKTISARLDELGLEDPYVAPEIAAAGYGFASPGSDTYSLALVFLERLSGVPATKLVQPDGSVQIPDAEDAWSYFPQGVVEGITEFFQAALTKGPMAPPGTEAAHRLSAEECAQRLWDIARQLRTDTAVEQGHLLDERYRVERVLGTGASARTYLATDTEANGLFALKQFLRPASIAETGEARREFDILRNFPHPRLPRVYDVYPASHDVHVKLEYIAGENLGDALPRYVGNVDRCRRLAGDLFSAVEHLETHNLLHRDIKPENVIIRDDNGDAVLIDFGVATPAGANPIPAGTPGYLPPEAYFADEPPPSTDRYALGVLLFRALTGRMPFADDGSLFEPRPLDSVDFLPKFAQPFAHALLKAVAADPNQRYAATAEFRAALLSMPVSETDREVVQLPDMINPTVDELRGLFRNSRRGNADNRGLDSEFARTTYVSTALDELLLPAILEQRPHAVFLSGNPGDGKTAFLEQLREVLRGRGGEPRSEDEAGWEWVLDGQTFRACYDASEAHDGQSADEQLLLRLRGLEGDKPPETALTVLVAINDGRLADVMERFGPEFPWLAGEVESAHDPARQLESGGAWVIDLKRRAYVGLQPDEHGRSVMRRVLKTLVAPERWSICEVCAARNVCPIRRNAMALGADGDPEASIRLEHLLLLSHLRGQRHITIRDLRSGLAYLITSDISCDAIHAARHSGDPLPAHPYWKSVFATEGVRDILLGELRPFNPARFAQPRLERFFFFHQAQSDATRRAALYRDGHDLPPTDDAVEWLAQVKQRLFFESRSADGGADSFPHVSWPSLLPYRFAADFIAALAGTFPLTDLLPRLARGIGRSDGLSGPVLNQGLCLRIAHSDVNQLTVLKQFPLKNFTLDVRRPPAGEVVEALPEALLLVHSLTGARAEITLDLFDLLLRLADGLESGSPELQPLLEDLAPFKSAVQLSNTKDLILVEADCRLHLLTQRDGKVVRTPIEQGAVSR
jgi:serine/threonine protein kinase